MPHINHIKLSTFYGNNIYDCCFNRFNHLLFNIIPENKFLNLKSLNLNDILELPNKNIFVRDIATNSEFSLETLKINIRKKTNPKINIQALKKEIARELICGITVIVTKMLLDSIYQSPIDSQTLIVCAAIIGTFKGLIRASMDTIAHNDTSLWIYTQKCSIEIVSEVSTEILEIFSNKAWNLGVKPIIKGFFKCIYKHCFIYYKYGFILCSQKELFFEMFKSGFKGFCRDLGFTLIDDPFCYKLFGSIIASLTSTAFFEIFINQAVSLN